MGEKIPDTRRGSVKVLKVNEYGWCARNPKEASVMEWGGVA